MEYKYVIVTSIPVFIYNNQFFIDDRWANDINGQLGLWKDLSIICPLKKLKERPADLIPANEQISFLTFSKFVNLSGIISKLSKRDDVIFEFSGTSNTGVLGFILLRILRRKIPQFITFDAPLSIILINNPNFSLKKKIYFRIYTKFMLLFRKFAAKSATGVISVGSGVLDEFDKKRKYEDKYLIIPLTLFDENEIFSSVIQDNDSKIRIVCMDSLSPIKGVYEALIAFNMISSKLKNIEFHIFGSGPQEKLIKNFIIEKKLEATVKFHGFVKHERIMEELNEVDILINLTKVGDINRTMWEGAAKGCAIIASNTEGVRSFFTNHVDAILVEPENVKDVAKALKLLCENPEIRYKLSKNATVLARRYTNKKVKILRKNWIEEKINN